MAGVFNTLNNNRRSIFVSLLVYLGVFGSLIIFSINTPKQEEYDGFLVDFEDLEDLILPDVEKIDDSEPIDDNRLNIAVNEALESNPTSNPYDYYDMEEQTDDYKEQLIKNALSEEDYEEYVDKEYEYDVNEFKETEVIKPKENKDQKETNFQGETFIKYNLKNRHERKLIIPTYKCEGYGKVIVKIVVNQNGKVTKAEIIKSTENNDCLNNAALNSAKKSLFDKNINAPNKQTGTISYTFMKQ